MHDFKQRVPDLEAFLLDMDGVLYVGEKPIEGAQETIQKLRNQGKKLAFLTNNSTRTRKGYLEKLSRIGLEINHEEIMTSAYATALRLTNCGNGKKCYVIGEEGLKDELKNAGFEIMTRENSEKASFVVVGMDRNLTYEKIWGGLSAILAGADFIATNPDPTYCTENGLAPGAGASVGALSAAAEREPSEVIGKPSTYMIEMLVEELDVSPEKTAIVGDRIDTDVLAGKKAGLTTILVLTGVNLEKDLEKIEDADKKPDYVLKSIAELLE